MNKKILKQFIQKYNLGGAIESVKYIFDKKNKTVATTAISDDKNIIVSSLLSNFDQLDDCEIGIHNTTSLNKLLNVLKDDITISYEKNSNDKIKTLILSDKNTEVQYVTADLSVIPKIPVLKNLPLFTLEIIVNSDFIDRYIIAKSSLPDVTNFSVLMNKNNKLEFLIGYSKINSNRIKLNIETTPNNNIINKPLHFNAEYLKEIFSANKECSETVLKISESGLAYIEFKNEDFSSKYYIMEIKNIE